MYCPSAPTAENALWYGPDQASPDKAIRMGHAGVGRPDEKDHSSKGGLRGALTLGITRLKEFSRDTRASAGLSSAQVSRGCPEAPV